MPIARGHRSPSHGSVQQPSRSRRETILLSFSLLIAGFFIFRISQYKVGQHGNTITAVLSTTQVLRQVAGGDNEQPAAVVTELVINSNGLVKSKKQQPTLSTNKQVGQLRDKPGLDSLPTKPDTTVAGTNGRLERGDNMLPERQVWQTDPLALQAKTKQDSDVAAGAGSDNSALNQPEVDLQQQQEQRQQAAAQETQVPVVTVPAAPRAPADFEWQTYLLYHPELRDQGVTSEQLAKEHYVRHGRAEGRIYKRLKVLMRYTACTGLINQHYSHIAAFSLCAVLGAELVLPPAVKRDSFAHYFSVFKEHNEVSWTPAPLESLLDVDKIVEFWKARGLTVHKTPALSPFPDLTQPEIAYPMYPQPEINPRYVTRLTDIYLRNLDLPELIEKARVGVITKASTILRENPDEQLEYIVLDFPCTFFMLRSLSNLRVVTEVSRSLTFSPYIQALADRVIHAMTRAGRDEYNAVHLRIEKDARDWSQIMGGEQVVWHGYVQSMRQAGFSPSLKLYVASGLLTYGATGDMENIIKTLKEFGLCSEVMYKELFLPQTELEALNSEQKALVDFLVLSRGRGFVGFGSSTFSFYLREFRVLNGIPRSSSVLVDASVIGTDPLFNSAGTVI